MRLASLVLVLFLPSFSMAGFTVAGCYSEQPTISHPTLSIGFPDENLISSKAADEELAIESYPSTDLVASYLEVIDGALSVLSTRYRLTQHSIRDSIGTLHFCVTAPRISHSFDPSLLRLDINLAINGVDMGGLSSISGAPTANGRRGMVRLEGMDGYLVESFAPVPFIPVPDSSVPSYEDPALGYAQESITVVVFGAVMLSALRNRRRTCPAEV